MRNSFAGIIYAIACAACGAAAVSHRGDATNDSIAVVKNEDLSAGVVAVSTVSISATGSITKNFLMGKFDPKSNSDFVLIEPAYTTRNNIYMHRSAYESYKSMHASAKQDGVQLTVISATRNFEYQKEIWEKKWKLEKYKSLSDFERAKDILSFSSMPGTSRHHWGTDIDLNSVDPKSFESGTNKKAYEWLLANAATFGFAQTYTDKKNGRTGYSEEKWHWSFMPLSKIYLAEYNRQITYTDITGFQGSTQAEALRVIEDYVNGIEAGLK